MRDEIRLRVEWYGQDSEIVETLGVRLIRGSHGSFEVIGPRDSISRFAQENGLLPSSQVELRSFDRPRRSLDAFRHPPLDVPSHRFPDPADLLEPKLRRRNLDVPSHRFPDPADLLEPKPRRTNWLGF